MIAAIFKILHMAIHVARDSSRFEAHSRRDTLMTDQARGVLYEKIRWNRSGTRRVRGVAANGSWGSAQIDHVLS